MILTSSIYEGTVAHIRIRPKRHRLYYRVFSLLLDLDELQTLNDEFLLFGYNRWAPIAFFDRDHGPTTNCPLRPWVEERMREAGLHPDGGPIRLLCYPRIFGYVFNPISVFFCYNLAGSLTAILYEVCNTYRERHTYSFPVDRTTRPFIRQSCTKALYVSPFNSMDSKYEFRIIPPGDEFNLVIRQKDIEGLLLTAWFKGSKEPIAGRALIRNLLFFPFFTVKVIACIHFEALRLWIKGLKVVAHHPAEQMINSSATRKPQQEI
ncbi:MAG: DUF1365 domain-containing protein [Magnetovibrio sp.]|nr:DUF1365 domain-containing protein [Magnetovibrio sp.]